MTFPYIPKHIHSVYKIAGPKENIFPHFQMLSDNGIAALFLETVASNPDEAWAFVSRHYSETLDLEALRDVLIKDASRRCPFLVKAPYEAESKNCLTRSVLVMDSEQKVKRLLHLHMIKEPDKYGQWKIYGVDQE